MRLRRRTRRGCFRGCGTGCGLSLLVTMLAAAIWWSSLGRERIIIPPAPPLPVPNAFDEYFDAGQKFEALGGNKGFYLKKSDRDVVWLPAEQVGVERNKGILEQVRAALGQPCRVPAVRTNDARLRGFIDAGKLVGLFEAERDVRDARSDTSGALASMLDSLRLTSDMMHGCTANMAASLFGRQEHALRWIAMHEAVLSAADCHRTVQQLSAVLRSLPATREWLEEERATALAEIKALDDPKEFVQYAGFGQERDFATMSMAGMAWHLMRDATIRAVRSNFARALTDCDGPASSAHQEKDARFSYGLQTLQWELAGGRARLRLCVIILAIREYKRAHGMLPPSLDDLGLDRTTTTDPFTLRPFVYRKQRDGYLLYSCGVDGKDDGGAVQSGRGTYDYPGDLGAFPFYTDPGWPVPHMLSTPMVQK